jgi:hypothetical protein
MEVYPCNSLNTSFSEEECCSHLSPSQDTYCDPSTLSFTSSYNSVEQDACVYYLHIFKMEKSNPVRYKYYASYEPWEQENKVICYNVKMYEWKPSQNCVIFLDPVTNEVWNHTIYTMEEAERVRVDSRFRSFTIQVFMENIDEAELKKPLIVYKEDSCVICLESIDHPLYTCGHYVHLDCIGKCKKYLCPICKVESRLPNLYYIHQELHEKAIELFGILGKGKSTKIAQFVKGRSKKSQEQILDYFLKLEKSKILL